MNNFVEKVINVLRDDGTFRHESKTSIKIKKSIYIAILPVPVCRYQITITTI